ASTVKTGLLAALAANQILVALTHADNTPLIALNQHLCRPSPAIVIGREHRAICSCSHHSQKISRRYLRERAVPGQKVACLAHRPNDIRHDLRPVRLSYWKNVMMRAVKRGADEVIHGRVHN